MCIPIPMNTEMAQAPTRPAPINAEALSNPERTSETADAVGRPDDQKKFPVIEDYWEARRRQRMLEMLKMQQAGPEGQAFNPVNPGVGASMYGRSRRGRGGATGMGGGASKGG